MQPEIMHRAQSHLVQLVMHPEFQRIAESQGVVEHQPQPDEHDRAGCRQQRTPELPTLAPGLGHGNQQDHCPKQHGRSRPDSQSVSQTCRCQPPASSLRLVQCTPKGHQSQHHQRIAATDRHFVNVATRQQRHRYKRGQAQSQGACHRHRQVNFREVATPHRP